jgi:hypothetical protein
MKKRFLIVAGLLGTVPVVGAAGPLYGTISAGGRPLADADVMVQCPGFSSPGPTSTPAKTDDRGSYSLRVQATGRCQMRVKSGNYLGPPFEVQLGNDPLRFDPDLDTSLKRVP